MKKFSAFLKAVMSIVWVGVFLLAVFLVSCALVKIGIYLFNLMF